VRRRRTFCRDQSRSHDLFIMLRIVKKLLHTNQKCRRHFTRGSCSYTCLRIAFAAFLAASPRARNHSEHCGLDREEASRMRALELTSQAPPPPTTLGAPWGRGCSLSRQSQTRPFLRTSSPSSITHPEACSGDCVLQLHCTGWHRWTLGWGNLVHDTTTTMPGPYSEESVSPRERRGQMRHRRSAVGNTWAGAVVFSCFSLVTAGHAFLSLRATSLSLQGEPAISERDDLGPPFAPPPLDKGKVHGHDLLGFSRGTSSGGAALLLRENLAQLSPRGPSRNLCHRTRIFRFPLVCLPLHLQHPRTEGQMHLPGSAQAAQEGARHLCVCVCVT